MAAAAVEDATETTPVFLPAKTPRPSSKKGRKPGALPTNLARRTSPRIGNNNRFATANSSALVDDQRQRLGEGNNLMSKLPPIQEIAVPPHADEEDALSEDLLAPSQQPQVTTHYSPRH